MYNNVNKHSYAVFDEEYSIIKYTIRMNDSTRNFPVFHLKSGEYFFERHSSRSLR